MIVHYDFYKMAQREEEILTQRYYIGFLFFKILFIYLTKRAQGEWQAEGEGEAEFPTEQGA